MRLDPAGVPSGRTRSRRARAAGRPPRAGELGRAEPLDEVAAADPAGLLERREHPVDGGEAAGSAFGRDRAAGHDAVAVEQHSAVACARTVGSASRLGQQRPAAGDRRGPLRAAGRAGRGVRREARPRPGVPAPDGAAGCVRGPCGRRRAGAQRREGVVGDRPAPHEVPERGGDVGVGRRPTPCRDRAASARKKRRRHRRGRRAAPGAARSARSSRRRGRWSAVRCRPGAARPSRRRRAARRDRTRAPRRRSSARRAAPGGSRDPGRQHERLQRGGRQDAPGSCSTTRSTPSLPRSRPPTPCHAGRNRASATAGTGSTSARSAASERRRRAQHLGVAVLQAAPPPPRRLARPASRQRPQLALDQPPGRRQPAQGVGDDRDAETEPAGQVGR